MLAINDVIPEMHSSFGLRPCLCNPRLSERTVVSMEADVAAGLANLAEELEDWDLATKTLRTISLLDSECPISRGEAFLRQGKIAYRMGDQKGALMWARRAKREEPDSGEIDRFIEEIS